jgi:hypothetical protein
MDEIPGTPALLAGAAPRRTVADVLRFVVVSFYLLLVLLLLLVTRKVRFDAPALRRRLFRLWPGVPRWYPRKEV